MPNFLAVAKTATQPQCAAQSGGSMRPAPSRCAASIALPYETRQQHDYAHRPASPVYPDAIRARESAPQSMQSSATVLLCGISDRGH